MEPAPYLDDDPTQRNPFLQNQDDEDDGSFDTGPTGMSNPYPYLPPAPRIGVNPGSPTPELRGILNSAPSPTASGNPPVTDAVNNAAQAYAQAVGARPTPPQPKWYQRLAAGALGTAAGVANASGRRMNPIDINPAVQGIMGGAKYNRQMQEWQNQVAARQTDLGAAQSAQSAWWKNRQLQNQEDLQQAEAQRAKSQSEYYEGRDPASVQRATIAATQKQMENMLKGRDQYGYQKSGDPVPQGAETIQDLSNPGYVYVVSPAMVPLPEELKQYAPGFKPGSLVPWSEFKRAEAAAQQDVVRNQNKPQRNATNPDEVLLNPDQFTPQQVSQARQMFGQMHREPRDPNAPKPATAGQMAGIETKKQQALAQAEKDAQKELSALQGVLPGPGLEQSRSDIYGRLEQRKQQIQDSYEAEIAAATGNSPGHFEYGAQQAAPMPAVAPKPQQAAAPKAGGGGRGPQGRMRVKLADGRTGTIDASEFDAKTMTKL